MDGQVWRLHGEGDEGEGMMIRENQRGADLKVCRCCHAHAKRGRVAWRSTALESRSTQSAKDDYPLPR
jgi:hypothetical protein